MILVTGATGTIGSHIVRLLTERGVPSSARGTSPRRRRSRPAGSCGRCCARRASRRTSCGTGP
ncbi:NAD-dependent epimerase/dehydratase family protein [Kitasatospora sp. NPDC006786]|uniref:NAD-dependent epimerase/dehydratase family protein n=1 Tax=unclassified Kitasatospora TaxID=2633591 RepID=UPI0033E08494